MLSSTIETFPEISCLWYLLPSCSNGLIMLHNLTIFNTCKYIPLDVIVRTLFILYTASYAVALLYLLAVLLCLRRCSCLLRLLCLPACCAACCLLARPGRPPARLADCLLACFCFLAQLACLLVAALLAASAAELVGTGA